MEHRKTPVLFMKWLAIFMLLAAAFVSAPSASGNLAAYAAEAHINTSKKQLYAGKTYKLKIRNSKETYTWTSDDKKVATVDKTTGMVTAVSYGEAVITAKSKSYEFQCRVTVKDPYLTAEKFSLWIGQSRKIVLKGASAVRYFTDLKDMDKVAVSEDGVVTALCEGENITVYVKDSLGRKYKCSVTVKRPYVKPGEKTLEIGGSVQLELVGAEAVEFFCNDIDDDKITVTGEGLVTAKSPGETIGVYATDGLGNVYSCLITVNEPPKPTAVPTPAVTEYYGLVYQHEKTEYVSEKIYNDISTDDAFLKACKESLEAGAESFEIYFTTGNSDRWIKLYQDHMGKYSDLASYGTVKVSCLDNEDGKGGWIRFEPDYKIAIKAIHYLKYSGYKPDNETLAVYSAASAIASEAVRLYPDNLVSELLYANNRICDIAAYSEDEATEETPHLFDADGVFFYGEAVCEGYTAAYKLILEMLGVENHVVVNSKDNHIWNRIKVNGIWYHTDVTWNDKTDPRTGRYLNSFFLLTDAQLAELDPSYHAWIKTYLP